MNAAQTFSRWQPEYAARGVPTFPVVIEGREKRPAVKNYLRIGPQASQKLAQGRFASAPAFGFAAGGRSGLTVLDVDSADEKIFADALDRHGHTPIKIRSGGGHFQAWYRWAGEGRSIRPDTSRPVDILGGGFVVAAPSKAMNGNYQIIEGSLDDLDHLPKLRREMGSPDGWSGMRDGTGRNNALYRRLGSEAHCCDDLDQLLDRARWLNSEFAEPMSDSRVVATARSVWKMTVEGRNRFGQHGAWFPIETVKHLATDPYLLGLLTYLKAHNGPDAVFMVADGLRGNLKWPRRQLADARRRAIEGGWIKRISAPVANRAARYVWGDPGHVIGTPKSRMTPAVVAELARPMISHDLVGVDHCAGGK